MPGLLTLLVIFLSFLGILFALFIYPLWLLIHCANDRERTTQSKTIWIIAMILIWPLGGWAYGLFASGRRLFQWFSGSAVVLGTILVISLSAGMLKQIQELDTEISNFIFSLNQQQTAAISNAERDRLKLSLTTLKTELAAHKTDLEKRDKVIALTDFYRSIIDDGTITRSEYDDWMNQFQIRQEVDAASIDQYVDQYHESKPMENW